MPSLWLDLSNHTNFGHCDLDLGLWPTFVKILNCLKPVNRYKYNYYLLHNLYIFLLKRSFNRNQHVHTKISGPWPLTHLAENLKTWLSLMSYWTFHICLPCKQTFPTISYHLTLWHWHWLVTYFFKNRKCYCTDLNICTEMTLTLTFDQLNNNLNLVWTRIDRDLIFCMHMFLMKPHIWSGGLSWSRPSFKVNGQIYRSNHPL